MAYIQAPTHAQSTLMKTGVASTYPLNDTGIFILKHGWAPATTRQYGAAVNKLLIFLRSENTHRHNLPITGDTLYNFILWCSLSTEKAVSSNTIKRYLTGLRMWHMLHEKRFPLVNLHRVRLLLKACKKTENSLHRPTRVGLTLQDVLSLADKLTTSSYADLVTKSVILVGFWGLARLGEITLNQDHPSVFVRRKDLSFSASGNTAYIRIRLPKTALPGEQQRLVLHAQPNRLDPVNVLHE